MQLEHILFPLDFSLRCRRAAPFVAAMASRFDAKITLITVAELERPGAAPVFGGAIDAWKGLHELEKELDNALIPEFANLRVDRIADLGDPAQIITHFAHTYAVDLIMMPTHGRGPFRRMLLGSITAKVLHDAHCPVWTDAHLQELGSNAPPQVSHSILCAVDTELRDVRVIHWAVAFAKEIGAKVRLVHAIPAAISAEAMVDPSHHAHLFRAAGQKMTSLQQEAGVALEASFRGGNPEEAIYDVALRAEADLVVIGRGDLNQPFGRLRSHAYAIIRDCPCPVISV
jgi:nucleotide-binding universal stress UspA family protein